LVQTAKSESRPIGDGVGRIVEHLSHHLAADAGVAAALDLDQGRHSVLVEEEVVKRQIVGAVLSDRDSNLAGDRQPAARFAFVDLVAGQQVGVAGQQ
jgi:hypothetical protein